MKSPPDVGWDEYSSGSTLDRDLQTHTHTRVKQRRVTLKPWQRKHTSSAMFTCEGVHQLRGFYIIEVSGSIPGGSDHLLSSHQPIRCYHHPLVALQGCHCDTDGGTFIGPFCLPIGLVFIREVHVIVQRGLVQKSQHTGTFKTNSDFISKYIQKKCDYSHNY